MLFQRRFTHCAMAIPFILHSPSLFLYILLARCDLIFEGDDSLFKLLLNMSHKNRLVYDIITVAWCFLCTSLHRELQDYSLRQNLIAFAVFQVLFVITQLLCQVSTLLTSAFKLA